MNNGDVVRQWFDDPENPELIEQVERIAGEGGDPVIIDDDYIGRVAGQGETENTLSTRALPLLSSGANETAGRRKNNG